jgi:CDP-6-deoxy-D-xylo-4-hexulose-3-dehydrase
MKCFNILVIIIFQSALNKIMHKNFYPLVKKVFNNSDIHQAIKIIKSGKLTMGKATLDFENFFSKKIKTEYSIMTNSGSSANLLAFQTLINPYRKNRLKYNDEVLIPSVCWPTSYWPIVQSNLKPIFVDIDYNNLNIDLNDLEKKITKKTRAIMLIHVLGDCADMDRILYIKKKYNLILIEDTCEALGSKYKNKFLGTFGEFSSFSFYASHQISAGEGGMLCCKDNNDNQIIKSLRSHGWSREIKNIKRPIFKAKKGLDEKFTFFNSGYNLRPLEVSSVIAHNQLKNLNKIKKIRKVNYKKIIQTLQECLICKENIFFVDNNKNVDPCWLSIPFLLKKNINRNNFLKKLLKKGIESRPIITGDFSQQPAIKKYRSILKINNTKYENANRVDSFGFYIGLHSYLLNRKEILKIKNAFKDTFLEITKKN